MLRALKIAAEKLKSAGVKVVDWEPFDHQRGWDILVRSLPNHSRYPYKPKPKPKPKPLTTRPLPSPQAPLYFPDGGKRWLDAFAASGEPVLPLTQHALDFSLRTGKVPLSVTDNWDLNVARETYRREHHALMRARGVDFILCPTYPGAGVLQGGARYWNYSAIWNILDLPAAVLPSGLACDRALDPREEGYVPRGEADEEVWKDCEYLLLFSLPSFFFLFFFFLPILAISFFFIFAYDGGRSQAETDTKLTTHTSQMTPTSFTASPSRCSWSGRGLGTRTYSPLPGSWMLRSKTRCRQICLQPGSALGM